MIGADLLQAMDRIRRSLRRQGDRPADLAELTGAQLELVRLVRRQPGVSVADAAAELRLAPNTVSTLVRRLGELHVLDRRVDPADRRVARLDLPAAVRRRVQAWRDRRVVVLDAAIASLPEQDRSRLERALPSLSRLAEALEQVGS